MKYIKLFESFHHDILENDVQVYRGEGNNIGNTTFVSGKYYADSPQFANQYGDTIFTNTLKKGLKCFDFDKIKNNPNQTVIPQKILLNPDKTRQFLLDKGYDITKNTNTKGVEYVVLNSAKIGKDQFYNKKGWSDNFDYMPGEPCWYYYDESGKELYWIISPSDEEEESKYKDRYVLFDVEKGTELGLFDTPQEAIEWFNKNYNIISF